MALLCIVMAIVDLVVISFAMELLSAPSDLSVFAGVAIFAILVGINYLVIHGIIIRLTKRRKEKQ